MAGLKCPVMTVVAVSRMLKVLACHQVRVVLRIVAWHRDVLVETLLVGHCLIPGEHWLMLTMNLGDFVTLKLVVKSICQLFIALIGRGSVGKSGVLSLVAGSRRKLLFGTVRFRSAVDEIPIAWSERVLLLLVHRIGVRGVDDEVDGSGHSKRSDGSSNLTSSCLRYSYFFGCLIDPSVFTRRPLRQRARIVDVRCTLSYGDRSLSIRGSLRKSHHRLERLNLVKFAWLRALRLRTFVWPFAVGLIVDDLSVEIVLGR